MGFFLNFIHWDVNPEIFSIGTFSVRWYGLMFVLSFYFGFYLGEKMFKYENVDQKWLSKLFYYLFFATIIGARLGHVFFYAWDYYSQHPWEILKTWHGGLASHGGAIGIIIAMVIFSKFVSKRPLLWILDRVVVPTALAGAFIRLGNLMNSEIYGIETSLPWGFIFECNGETVAKHPTQVYEALCYLIGFATLMYMYWKTKAKDKPGMLLGVFFIIVFLSRFFIEFIKENQEAFEATMALNMGQWLSIPFIAGGVWLLTRAVKRPVVVYEAS